VFVYVRVFEMLDAFARPSHQSTGFLQTLGSKSLLSKDVHGAIPRNTSSSDVTDTHKVRVCLLCCLPVYILHVGATVEYKISNCRFSNFLRRYYFEFLNNVYK